MPPALTRRRDLDSPCESWRVRYGDIDVGHIGQRAGVPTDQPQWRWSVAFYPASHRGIRSDGIAETFDDARAAFETAWRDCLPRCTPADFEEYRFKRAFLKWKYRMWAEGCKLPTQTVRGSSRCFCAAIIGIATTEEHVRAHHMKGAP